LVNGRGKQPSTAAAVAYAFVPELGSAAAAAAQHLQLHHELLYTTPIPLLVHHEMLQLQGDSRWLAVALLLDSRSRLAGGDGQRREALVGRGGKHWQGREGPAS